ncbi:MAG: hypothetical protein K1X74_06670 [Pirellulales bacterium]|nr:hypothetical protein [Pirellulales bacterium]
MHRIMLSGLAVACLGLPVAEAPAGIVVGGFDDARGGISAVFNGSFVDDARNSLLSHFDVDAIVGTTELTPAFLSGIDLLILSNAITQSVGTPLSPAEQTAVHDFVHAGGRAMVVIDGFMTGSSQSYATPFGLTIEDDDLSGVLPVIGIDPPHPVWDGPYGDQLLALFYGAGKFTFLNGASPVARAFIVPEPGIVAFDHDVLGPGSGRVVVFGDTTPFIDGDVNPAAFPAHEALWLNTLHYLIEPVPEPATWTLAVCGAIGWLGMARWQHRRRAT